MNSKCEAMPQTSCYLGAGHSKWRGRARGQSGSRRGTRSRERRRRSRCCRFLCRADLGVLDRCGMKARSLRLRWRSLGWWSRREARSQERRRRSRCCRFLGRGDLGVLDWCGMEVRRLRRRWRILGCWGLCMDGCDLDDPSFPFVLPRHLPLALFLVVSIRHPLCGVYRSLLKVRICIVPRCDEGGYVESVLYRGQGLCSIGCWEELGEVHAAVLFY